MYKLCQNSYSAERNQQYRHIKNIKNRATNVLFKQERFICGNVNDLFKILVFMCSGKTMCKNLEPSDVSNYNL